MPQNPDLIATKSVSGHVYIFDRTKHPSDPDPDGVCKPDIECVGQDAEGWVCFWLRLSRCGALWLIMST